MAEKQLVNKEIESFIPDDLTGPVLDVINFLENKRTVAQQAGFQNITIKIIGYDDCVFGLYGDRLETDEEFHKRMKILRKNIAIGNAKRAKKVEKEKQQLKRLLAKYPEVAD